MMPKKKMKASILYGPEDVRYEETNIPNINNDEVLVKIKAVLTCGTDLKTYIRGGHPILIKKTPALFGHQFAGTVVKIGKNVKKFKLGQNIIPVNSCPCFKCIYCKKNDYSLCENISFLNGAFAEYITVPKNILNTNTYTLPKNTPFKYGSVLESLAVVLHGIEKSEIKSGKIVCIIGTGLIGLLFVAMAKKISPNVILLGKNNIKLNIGKQLGAKVLNIKNLTPQGIKNRLRKLSGGLDPDIVIEAVGKPEIWELATLLVGNGGLVNFFGGCKKGTTVTLDTYRLHYNELKILGVFHHTPYYVKKALKVLSNKDFQSQVLNKIISFKASLQDLDKAFKLQKSGKIVLAEIIPSS